MRDNVYLRGGALYPQHGIGKIIVRVAPVDESPRALVRGLQPELNLDERILRHAREPGKNIVAEAIGSRRDGKPHDIIAAQRLDELFLEGIGISVRGREILEIRDELPAPFPRTPAQLRADSGPGLLHLRAHRKASARDKIAGTVSAAENASASPLRPVPVRARAPRIERDFVGLAAEDGFVKIRKKNHNSN